VSSLFDDLDDLTLASEDVVAPAYVPVAPTPAPYVPDLIAPTPTPEQPLGPVSATTDPLVDVESFTRGGQPILDMFSAEDLAAMRTDELFPKVDEDIATDYGCPCCGYAWSGNPKPKTADLERETVA
jgi:hypothetical protein